MKAIQAAPKNISDIFQDSYIIPEFQRPYSWEEDECSKLIEDVTGAFLSDQDNSYYLGSIVLYPQNEKKTDVWNVVDGQQRLTTVTLLIKALYEKARTAKALERCLRQENKLTGELKDETKINTCVLDNDKINLEKIILRNITTGNDRFSKNYNYIAKKVDEFIIDKNADALNDFILWFLQKVTLLPIECDSLDDALVIFNTVNNRGMPLGDADIFKAYMFKSIATNEDAKKELIKRWDNLNGDNGDDNISDLFRYLMHIKRAEAGETSREVALRKFFESNGQKSTFENWRETLETFEKINSVGENFRSSELKNLWEILCFGPNDYVLYPIVVFWYKYADKTKENDSIEWRLSEEKEIELRDLIMATIKYFYANAIAYHSVNAVKDITYKVYGAIYRGEDYLSIYRNGYEKIFEIFKNNILSYEYGKWRWSLTSLLAILNNDQDQEKLCSLEHWEVEHILPKKGGYNNYNGWTEEQYNENLNSLGNFVLLEKELNIRASNEFFQKKKKEYQKSRIAEARDLASLEDWTYNEWKKRNKEKEDELLNFFKEI